METIDKKILNDLKRASVIDNEFNQIDKEDAVAHLNRSVEIAKMIQKDEINSDHTSL